MSSKGNANALLKAANQEGLLSRQSIQALNVVDIGAQIQEALGINVDVVTASEVVLLTQMVDDSGSIRFASNAQAIRDGHNLVIDALAKSKQNDSILAHTRYLNGQILFPYCPLKEAIKMDSGNYNPNGGTPLYDESVVLLGTVLAKTQEFAQNGVPVRTITLLLSDGADEHSIRATAAKVAYIVNDMLKAENHIVAAMGVDDGRTDFRVVYKEMGIRDEWILTPGNNPSEIRKAFNVFSQSAIRASQNAQSFSKTAIGGFGTP
jgi:hypothetical protein